MMGSVVGVARKQETTAAYLPAPLRLVYTMYDQMDTLVFPVSVERALSYLNTAEPFSHLRLN